MTKGATIVFMGTPDFAVPSLQRLAARHHIKAVMSQPPRPGGRGMKIRPSPVHAMADQLGLPVETPEKLDDEAMAMIKSHATDFLIVVAYGLILPEPVLALPAKAAINGHASLLPRWRGAAPIHRAIAAGDSITGTTAMLMARALDSGPMLVKREEVIRTDDTAASLHDRLADLTATTLLEAVDRFDSLTPTPQDESAVTWAEKISPAEAEMDFTLPAEEAERRIRAFAPFPGAWFAIPRDADAPHRIKVLAARRVDGKGQPGQVLGRGQAGGPVLACGTGALELMRIQPQGKPVRDGAAFLNGNALPDRMDPAATSGGQG